MKSLVSFALVFLGFLTLPFPFAASAQTTWIVDQGGAGDFMTIQQCLDDPGVLDGDTCLVNPGTYTENLTLNGKAVAIVGAGGARVTVLDGNAAGSVVTVENVEAGTVLLDGLTIRNGSAERGGGVYCSGSSLRIENCTITENAARIYGGGIYGSEDSPLAVTNCTVSYNTTMHGNGCGIYCSGSTITNCEVVGNSLQFVDAKPFNNGGGGGGINCGGSTVSGCIVQANYGTTGGGISCSGSQIVNSQILDNWADDMLEGGIVSWGSNIIMHCVISGNHASHSGGGIFNFGESWITNSLITRNSAIWGGGIYSGSSTVTNCTFSLNQAYYGGAIYLEDSSVANSILWGDSASNEGPEILMSGGSGSVVYSDVQGGWPGEGNIDLDPIFVSGPTGLYYLSQTAAGQAVSSPCVDAGDPSTAPWGWDAFTTRTDQEFDVGTVDMGYHYPRFCLDQDEDGYSIQGGACGQVDCDDFNPDVNPGAAEGPRGDASCGDGLDNDCDGLADLQDPDCKSDGGYSAVANAEAATYGEQTLSVSGLCNAWALLLLPAGVVIVWTTVRRER